MSEKKSIALLFAITLAWGISGSLMKIGVSELSPFSVITWRFGIAFAAMLLISGKRFFSASRKAILLSFYMSIAMFLTFASLLFGLQTVSASTAGFLSGIAVIFIPFMEWLVLKKRLTLRVCIAMVIVFIGIALMSLKEGFSISTGAILCLGCSFFNAVYILVTGICSKIEEPLTLGIWQLFWMTLWGGGAAAVQGTFAVPGTAVCWICMIVLALLCSAFGYVMQPVAQVNTDPSKAGFIMSLEPVFAIAFAYVILGELFSVKEAIGAALVFLSIVIVC